MRGGAANACEEAAGLQVPARNHKTDVSEHLDPFRAQFSVESEEGWYLKVNGIFIWLG